MTKGMLTGMCKAEDCLYATAHKETKLLFSLNWTLNYSLCFGSMAGYDLFSVEVVTKHKAKTLAYIPKYNFKLLSSNKSLIIIMIWCD